MSSNSPPNLTSPTPTTPTADQGQTSADQGQTSVDQLLPSAEHVSTIEFNLDKLTSPHLSMTPPTPSKRTKMAYKGPNKMAYRRTKIERRWSEGRDQGVVEICVGFVDDEI
ncbi:hypothetical protein Drorol1_Dr00021868 [Drosera rotundifolia]